MKRRAFLSLAGASPVALAQNQPAVETQIVRLNLRHTWTTVMSSSEYRDTIHLYLRREGITGTGEGAPIVRYHESAQSAQKAIAQVRDLLGAENPRHYRKLIAQVHNRIQGEWAAKAAIEIALLDWVSQAAAMPLSQFFGLDPRDAPLTTFSIGIDKPEVTKAKVREADPFPILKIKVGLDSDEETIAAVRSVTNKPLRVDANEGWKTKEQALQRIKWLESQNVELIEQPLPASMFEEQRWLRGKVNIPILADEACLRAEDIPKLAQAYDGINIKLDKCGGPLQAIRMIEMARALKLKVMIGCMISSSVTITAAAHVSPLVDYADLDGNLLIANDPYQGVTVKQGRLVLPQGAGLGLKRIR